MKATRSRGAGVGLVVALVIFVVLFLAGLFATIVFHNNWKESEDKVVKLRQEIDTIYNGERESDNEVKDAVKSILGDKDGKGNVVSTLYKQKKAALHYISNNALSLNSAKQAVEALQRKVRDDTDKPMGVMDKDPDGKTKRNDIVDGFKSTIEDFDAALRQIAQVQGQLKTANEQLAKVEEERAKLEAAHRDGLKAVAAQLDTVVTTNTASQQTAAASLKQVQEGQTKAAEEATKQANELQDKIAEAAKEKAKLQNIIRELRDKLTSSKSDPGSEFQPDGEVLSVIPDQNLVTIPLGVNDHLFIGLTFEVFARKKGINKDEFGDVRGKATIEVIKIKERSSEARIVRIERNANVFEGDLFINLVYDRYRTFKFYVSGKFDLNNDGKATEAETRRVKSMVSQWGGILAEEMNYEVDFLVLGVRPEAPRAPREGDPPLTPEQIEEKAAQEKALKEILNLEGEARTLRIPILNQNRFLRLVGYYER